ncbi:MAG: DNA-directed RNA polymerase subunit alpha [Candidatus Yanofskybacteria bacterium CG10_big_fil_rev_8_21_14_0_10_46_23]|uniref:DNA-directed RNA polymerase subunit alpha n=1 Tax=Candidatus Yanofskybacteria bacterium CG10_big_fil_rev_8_21_14_0_10_46_23 TaxID=1975098 RepID=A0A2H0R4T9_9BACT|nr:MAG: DNA-directed RNA polymerase subunit alpha [Candidatus Yanofskybacteria bacterium CG10_big_fil_rev_8_21_14_0_10_46_23]
MIQLPEKFKKISESGHTASFEISPLYPGYGVTIGNAIRRVLLSSLDGSAITSVKIKGVDHEFSNLAGSMEDVIEIIINLKQIRLNLFTEGPITLKVKAKGEKKVTAKDIETTADVEIANPDQIIATLTDKKAELDMEITVERGVGYVPAELQQKEKLSVGVIMVDAIFSPVQFANFKVENIRVGDRTDYNKLMLDIQTDGTISPQEALQRASYLLINGFQSIVGEELSTAKVVEAEEKPKKTPKTKKPAKK